MLPAWPKHPRPPPEIKAGQLAEVEASLRSKAHNMRKTVRDFSRRPQSRSGGLAPAAQYRVTRVKDLFRIRHRSITAFCDILPFFSAW
jgi:hypothetical protein